jgi:hypothetical protein
MKRSDARSATVLPHYVPHDWARLIRKLRWIGLDDEAKHLERAVSTLPPEERCGVSFGPFSTD